MIAPALVALNIPQVSDVTLVFTELLSEITEIGLEMLSREQNFRIIQNVCQSLAVVYQNRS